VDAAGRGQAGRAVADPPLARAGEAARHGAVEHGAAERLPGHARDVERGVPERGRAKHTESSDYFLGTTADQIAAKQLGRETQLPSLELAMDMLQTAGQCDNGYACVYQNNLSWSSPTTPLPAEAHPRLVFESLFGEGGGKGDRQAALRRRASLLDFVKDDLASLGKTLGPADRARVDQYLDSVREVERRIQKAERDVADNPLPTSTARSACRPRTPTTPG
jgi:hypothetical protein